MKPAGIPTDRLVLEAAGPESLAALRTGDGGFDWLGDGPYAGTREAAGMVLRAHEKGVLRPRFGLYVLVRREDRRAIGSMGFHSAPDEDGRTEIGYDLVPAARGHGYATEALRALAGWALARDDVRRLFATVAHDNVASRAVLERTGFVRVWDDEGEYAYELRD